MELRKIKISENLDTSERIQLFRLLEKKQAFFQSSELGTYRTNLTEHHINTDNAAPIKQRLNKDEVKRQVDEMMRNKGR
ncbi:hypothetical protein BpHYR1_051418 [Brachionus plicatilis]|uniref:Uncharacterized protein n=1 Tax=Brachionus plicatilis TaxID=10195 RepID=A0A3M7S228_BRAPC|nr:hypothetical protein BpHYR1_051418 [Brachionus plicatilis]